MKHKAALVCALLMLWILPAAPVLADADCIHYVGGNGGCINARVEVDNASLATNAMVGEDWALAKTYQGENTIGVTITTSYDGGGDFALTGVSYADVGGWQGPVALLPPLSSFTMTENSIDFKVDISSLDSDLPYLALVLSLNFSVESELEPTVTKGIRLVFYPKHIIDVAYHVVPDAKALVDIYEVDLTPDSGRQTAGGVATTRIAVANAMVTPHSKEKKFLFIPESQATMGNGVIGRASFDVVANTVASVGFPVFSGVEAAAQTSDSEDPAKLEDTIQVAVSSNGKEEVKEGGVLFRYYAVVDAVENGVSAKGVLGGDYVPVNVGDRFAPGTMLKLVITVAPDRKLLKPYIKLKFYDNSTGEAELLNQFENDPRRALYVKLGEAGVEGVTPCDIVTDASNFMKDVAANPIDYGRVVITHGIGAGVSALTGGAGWIVSKTLGAGSQWLIRKYAGPTGPLQRLISDQASGPITMRMGQGAAYRFESIVRNQEIALYNRGADVLLSDSGSTVVIPERSSVSFKPSGAVSYPIAIFPDSAIPVIPVVLNPAHGGAVDSLYSCLQASFSGSLLPNTPEPINSSFRARLNGRLISPFMHVNGELQTAVYCPPEDAPLKDGENVFRAAISTANSGRNLAESRFMASAAVPAAPRGLRSAAGKDYSILLWNRSKENYVATYKVYHADSPTGPEVLLGDAAEPIYAIPAIDAGRYYSVRACDAHGRCSAESPRLQTDVNPSYVPAVPVLSGVSSQLQEDRIVISVAAGSPAPLAWRLQKATSQTGPFTDVVAGRGLIIGDSYTVTETNQGVPYWFRAVPVGSDLVEGAAFNIGPLLLEDLPPPQPDGLSVEFDQGVARVEWNPSAANDLAGYYLYRSIDDGVYEQIAGGAPITNSYYNDWVESDQRISWKVAAVDMQNQLSAVSDPVYGSSWGLGSPGVFYGTITVDANPDVLNAPWTLTGPNAFSKSSNGDAVVDNLMSGTYTLTWGNYSGWDKPASRTVTLAGEPVTIVGTYQRKPVISTPPTEGAVGSNITINGSNFGSARGGGYVDFNGTRGTIVSWSDTQIVVKVPYGATSGCLKVVTDYGVSDCIKFIVFGTDIKKSLSFLMLLLGD